MSDIVYLQKGAEWVFKALTDHARIEMCSKLGMPVKYMEDVFIHVKDGPPRDRLIADFVAVGLEVVPHGNKPKPTPKDISAYLA